MGKLKTDLVSLYDHFSLSLSLSLIHRHTHTHIYIYIVPSGVKMGYLYFYTSNGYALRFTHISTLINIVTDSGDIDKGLMLY